MSGRAPKLVRSQVTEQCGSTADRDAATFLDPDTYLQGEPGHRDVQPQDEGDWVVMHYMSANHDVDAFERPGEFDVACSDSGHAAFGGAGTHVYLGALRARLEQKLLCEELYPAVPRLVVAGEPVRLRSCFFNGVKSLPCTTGSVA